MTIRGNEQQQIATIVGPLTTTAWNTRNVYDSKSFILPHVFPPSRSFLICFPSLPLQYVCIRVLVLWTVVPYPQLWLKSIGTDHMPVTQRKSKNWGTQQTFGCGFSWQFSTPNQRYSREYLGSVPAYLTGVWNDWDDNGTRNTKIVVKHLNKCINVFLLYCSAEF